MTIASAGDKERWVDGRTGRHMLRLGLKMHHGLTLALLAAGWLPVRWWQDRQWSRFVDSLRTQPGLVVTSFERQSGRFVIRGLRDPLSSDPQSLVQSAGLNPRQAEFHWAAYYALDDAIVQQRAISLLHPPSTAKILVQNGVLRIEGQAPAAWIAGLDAKAALLAGVGKLDLTRLVNENQAELDHLQDALAHAVVKFPIGSAEIPASELQSLRELSPKIISLLQTSATLHRDLVLTVVGHSDSTGPEATNFQLSQLRADRVRSLLIREGLPIDASAATGVASSQPLQSEDSEQARQLNRSATFRVSLRPVPHS